MTTDKDGTQPESARFHGSSSAHGFAPNYLLAKKTIDDRALNKNVWHRCAAELGRQPGSKPLRVLEIGAGIGTMLERAVDWGLFRGRVSYIATDGDPAQTAAARDYLTCWAKRKNHSLQWQETNLGRLRTAHTLLTLHLRQARIEDLAGGSEFLGSCDLLLAHAVLDLIDIESLLPELLAVVKDGGLFYSTCNFDGATYFLPPCEGDQEIIDQYHNSMEQRLTGASLTGRRLVRFLEEQGTDLLASGRSDWLIEPRRQNCSPEENHFLKSILDMVAKELAPARPRSPHSETWMRRRRRQLSAGTLAFGAAHLDVLARCRL